MDKTVGIIGGMGPLATADIFQKIIQSTPVEKEDDHIRVLIDSNPKLPNRQRAILYGEESPLPQLISMAQGLEKQGADFLILGANTPHYYFDELQSAVHIPILHMLKETMKEIVHEQPEIKKVGLLATHAVVKTKLFQKCSQAYHISIVLPEEKIQNQLHDAIFKFKEDSGKELLHECIMKAVADLSSKADAIILGCTELTLALENKQDVRMYDPNEILARRVVQYAKDC